MLCFPYLFLLIPLKQSTKPAIYKRKKNDNNSNNNSSSNIVQSGYVLPIAIFFFTRNIDRQVHEY